MRTADKHTQPSGRLVIHRLLPGMMVIIVLGIALLAGMPGAWALPSQSPDFQTVPTLTPTPRPGATNTPRPGSPTNTPVPGQPTDTPAPGQPTNTPAPGEPTSTLPPDVTPTATATLPASGAAPVLPADCWAVPTPGFSTQSVVGLDIAIQSDQFLVVPGQQVTLRYVIANEGDTDLNDLLLCAPLEPFLGRGDVSASDGETRLVAGGLILELAELAAGESAQVEVQLTIPADAPLGSVIENQAWLFAEGIQASSDLLTWALPPAYLPPTGHRGLFCGER